MRTGIADLPLHYGRTPSWLFERMKKLSRSIVVAIVEEFGPEEFLKRISDPIWFQSLGCVIGFDWNSSGLTTTTLGAIKAGLFDIQDELGIFVCGSKGKTSRKTPKEIEAYGISRGFEFAPNLIYASKIAAKIDSALIQDNFSLYHHNLIFTNTGEWAVVQQGLNGELQKARPQNFEELLSLRGIGPKTIRALSLVAELIYGAKPSYEDPTRYSFSHGGKDGTPYFPRPEEMASTIKILEKGIKKSKISNREKIAAQRRLRTLTL